MKPSRNKAVGAQEAGRAKSKCFFLMCVEFFINRKYRLAPYFEHSSSSSSFAERLHGGGQVWSCVHVCFGSEARGLWPFEADATAASGRAVSVACVNLMTFCVFFIPFAPAVGVNQGKPADRGVGGNQPATSMGATLRPVWRAQGDVAHIGRL